MPSFQLGTIPARSNIPDANDNNIVVALTKRDQGESPVLAILFFSIILTAKPGPYSTKEHCTSRRWVSLNLGKRSTEITHQFQGGWADRIGVRINYKLPREPRDVC